MRAYWAILSARFRVLLQYRAAALAGFGTQLFWGLIRIMIFAAFYRSSSAKQPMSYREVVTYVWLGQAMLAMLPWNVDRDVLALIRSGNVAYELLRPMDLYGQWYVRAVAWRTAPALLRAAPMFVVAMLFFAMAPPSSPASALAWAAATCAGVLLAAAITNVTSISAFWTVSGEGIGMLLPTAVTIFSGLVIPLPLFPEWAQPILSFLPFRGLMDVPFRLYMGHIPPRHALGVLAHQLAWTLAIVALGRCLIARGLRRLAIQGG